MKQKNATEFVEKMQNDREFRKNVSSSPTEDVLVMTLKEHGFSFQQKELVNAMAKCMDSMEQCSESECS